MPRPLRYVALGDSYTIGTALDDPAQRWPDQLVRALGGEPPALELVANLGVNGSTSGDVVGAQLPQLDGLHPDLVSLLVGVNDVVRRIPAFVYPTNIRNILDHVLARLPADRIVTVATPDYTVTPAGADYGDPAEQAAGIRRNNDVVRELAERLGVAFVDIHDLSLRAATDRSLVADDGLHPSGAQYALWVERIAPVVARLIGRTAGRA
ncbi:MAG TPA: SGNH/GDSL hydrolase family protein [Candidatus Limnocylindrales bacterium]|nr:SGNH/GDSL hydrolase family protein [Candidatus Limnocylindrales bacterium]